eukprot:2057757-Pyramimonas_sp.AAC.1
MPPFSRGSHAGYGAAVLGRRLRCAQPLATPLDVPAFSTGSPGCVARGSARLVRALPRPSGSAAARASSCAASQPGLRPLSERVWRRRSEPSSRAAP